MIRRALTLAAAAVAITPAAARAGTYEVLSCGAAGGVNHAWTAEVSSDAITATDACASGGAFAADDLFIQFGGSLGVYTRLGAPDPTVGAYGYWRFEVPDPLRIVANRSVEHAHSESDGWRLVTDADYGELSHCQTNEPGSGINDNCDTSGGTYGTPLPSSSAPYAQPARWVRVGFRCTIAPCDSGTTAHAAGDALFSDGTTVSDQVAPTVSIAGVPGTVAASGAVSATVTGSDQTGISRLELLVDGQVVASSARPCDFTRVLPCEAPGGQVSAKLSSTGLAPGTHQVTARSYDAAGNSSASGAQPVVASAPQSQPTPAPVGSTPTPGATPTPGGTGSRALQLRISSIARRGSRVRVRGQVAAGCRSPLTVKVTAAGRTRKGRVTVGSSGRWGLWVSGVRRRGKLRVSVSAAATSGCAKATARASRS